MEYSNQYEITCSGLSLLSLYWPEMQCATPYHQAKHFFVFKMTLIELSEPKGRKSAL